MKKVIALVILSIVLTVFALFVYRWMFGFVFGGETGWLKFFLMK